MKDFLSFDPKLLFYGFFIVFFASYGQTFFISLYNTEIKSNYGLSDGQFGLVYSIGTLASSFFLIGFAKLIDSIDLRIYTFVVSLGLSLACLCMFISYKSVFFLIFIIFALRFFGQGAMSHAGETTMARYFGSNRGKALSISTLGGMIGVMLLPSVAVELKEVFGWRIVWLFSSLSILFIFIPLIFILLKNQDYRHKNFKNSIKNLPNQKKWRTKDVIFDKKFYIYLPISIATPFISTGLTFHQIFIITEKGWTIKMLANGFVFLGIFSILGLMFGGPIVDKYNTKKVVYFNLVPLFLGILILNFFDHSFYIIIYMSFLGISLGIGTPFIGALWAELYGLESLGTVKAFLHALMVFFSALSPVVFGYMIDMNLNIFSLSLLSILIILFSTFLPMFFFKSNE